MTHPNPAFRASDDLLTRASAIGFATIFATTPDGPMAVHAPLTLAGTDRMRFHVARANRVTPHLAGATVLASVRGADGYISPNWYAVPGDQVPTWNYVAIEIDGMVSAIDENGLIGQLDTLAAAHEPRVMPDRPWTRDKMNDDVFRRMLRGIAGFEIAVTAVRGTTKLSQNKSAPDRAGVIAGLRASENYALADLMEAEA